MESAKSRLLGVVVLSLCAAVLGAPEQRVKEGANVDFSCNYPPSFQNPRIEWKFSSSQNTAFIYYNGELTASYKNRAQFFPQGLRLQSVTPKDAGEYVCEVTGAASSYIELKTPLVVLVPPSTPVAEVPTSLTIGSSATLRCVENGASPPPKFTWYKNNILMPEDPKTNPNFQNSSYIINPDTGDLTFDQVTQSDSGEYYCGVSNEEGSKVSTAVTTKAYEKNVGGIVAAVIIVLLILALIGFGLWFAFSRGYIGKKTNKKVIYSQPSDTRSDKNFQQTSSFVV
ncbi:junctional adhesion molecule A isoform X2 [Bufo bufo]|uniref:junctional adhesion molecule A isoform X2 n=1 Tax=Bufo bufo TaxID=8384 RepID=UPI001ABE1A55|nr:junctional adhesion molecule A isoform X2 [Bufo bufo]